MLIEGEEDDLLGGVAFPAHILLLIDLYEAIAATIRMRFDYRAIIIGQFANTDNRATSDIFFQFLSGS